MQGVNRELSSREVISQGFSLFRQQFLRILVPLLVGAIVAAVLRLLFASQLIPINDHLAAFNLTDANATELAKFLPVAEQAFSLSALEELVLWIAAAPFFGLAVMIAYGALTGETSARSSYLAGWLRKIPALLLTSAVIGTVVSVFVVSSFIGAINISLVLFLLVLPSVIFLLMTLMFIPAIVIENASILSAIRRSRKLVSKRWKKAFTIALFAIIINTLLGVTFNGLITFLNPYESAFAQPFYTLISDILGVSLIVILYQTLLAKEVGESQPSAANTTTSVQS